MPFPQQKPESPKAVPAPQMDPEALMNEIKEKLGQLSALVTSSEVEPDDKQAIQGLVTGFDAFYQSMTEAGSATDPMEKGKKKEVEMMKPEMAGARSKVEPMMM